MKQTISPLIAAMLRPAFYLHNPSEVEFRQTHISYIFLSGPYAYKVKKTVKFDFLDYSTLENRRHFCAEEMRLNRRLAPNTYLGVVQIGRANGSFFLDENNLADRQRVVEYAVKMNRLPENRMLRTLVLDGAATTTHLLAVAKKLAAFHERAPDENSARYGSLQAIASKLSENFRDTGRFIGQTLGKRWFETIQDFSNAFLKANSNLLERRISEGRVRECHGDLRAEHICLIDDIEIFDCVEFDESLRYGDVASEIGFLAMDLDFLGQPELSAKLESAYATAARDANLAALLPFYKCYRACVRGKVESLKHEETDVAEPERREAALQAMRYFLLATRYAKGPTKAMLLVVCGMVASGKSTVARLLSARTGFSVLDSDRVRKKLAGLSPTTRAPENYHSGIYSNEFTRLTYDSLVKAAEDQLAKGHGIIIDATFGNPEHRRSFTDLARRFHIPLLFLECQADEDTIRRRLKERQSDKIQVSDATWSIYEQMRADYSAPSEIPDSSRFELDTERELLSSLIKLEYRF
jgi:uncharacterized protein